VSDMNINLERLLDRLDKLAQIGKDPNGGVTRIAFSPEDIKARQLIREWMGEAGLKVTMDEAANIIGRRDGIHLGQPAVLCGSHIDTVNNGGIYDGTLGVLAALEIAQSLEESEIDLNHPFEVIVFTDEEGSMIGSNAVSGIFESHTLDLISLSGMTVKKGLKAVGGDPNKLAGAARNTEALFCYLELHIEQGGVLEQENLDIGIVEGIIGIKTWEISVSGRVNHAGTTPMTMRQDALVAASEFVVAVNQTARELGSPTVATIGVLEIDTPAPNVIPGRVDLVLEIRDLSEQRIETCFNLIKEKACLISEDSGSVIEIQPQSSKADPCILNQTIRQIFLKTADNLAFSSKQMPSGAGHDAQNMAAIIPAGMIFVPSKGGVSHSYQEFTSPQQIEKGVNLLAKSILKIDQLSQL
jgi:N-carbamoyl-L-amino-acid hydrolase